MGIQRSDFKLKLKDGAIKDFEKVVLSSGACELFMPMGFVSMEEGELVAYNCSGYTSLRQCDIVEIKEAFDILEKTFILVRKAGEYLITPSRITLNLDTIFYKKQTKQVRIAYVPAEEPYTSLRENMAGFLTQMEEMIRGNERSYLQKVRSKMEEQNYYINDLINTIGEMRRQVCR